MPGSRTLSMHCDESLIKSIKGFLDAEEGRRLYEIAKDAECRISSARAKYPTHLTPET